MGLCTTATVPRRRTIPGPKTGIQPCTSGTITRRGVRFRDVAASCRRGGRFAAPLELPLSTRGALRGPPLAPPLDEGGASRPPSSSPLLDVSPMDGASSAPSDPVRRLPAIPTRPRFGFGPWDVRMALRAAAIGVLAFSVAWLVTAATDEGGISWAERAGRVMPIAPACSAVGAWAVLLHAVARGETLALASLGRQESRIVMPAALGAAAISLMVAAVIMSFAWIGLDGFYPAVVHANVWIWSDGAFVDLARGVVVGSDGAPRLLRVAPHALAPMGPPTAGRASAALATAAAGLGLPRLAAHAVLSSTHRNLRIGGHGGARGGPRSAPLVNWRGRLPTVLVGIAAVAMTAVLFQSAAATRTPALLAPLPSLALLAYSEVLFWRSRAVGA